MTTTIPDEYRLTVAHNVISIMAGKAGLDDHPSVTKALMFIRGASDVDPLPFPDEPLFEMERLIPNAPAMYEALCAFCDSVMQRTNNGNIYAPAELHRAELAARRVLAAVEGA